MKKHLLITLLLLASFSVAAQQKLELDNRFTQLSLSGNLRATIYHSDSVNVTYITVYGIDAQRLKWNQKGDMFRISLASGLVENDSYAELEIHCPTLTKLICEGATVTCADTITGNNLFIEAQSSINSLNLLVDVAELDVKASANTNISIGGYADWATITATLGAKVNCAEALFTDCTANAGQNAEITVRVDSHLDANATAKASIFYFGSPTTKIKTSLAAGVTPVIPPPAQ